MNIAFVDDCSEEIEKLSAILQRKLNTFGDAQHQIYTYNSGESFLSSWKTGLFDLIILDIFMDNLTGIDVAREIRKTDQDVRLVFCTTSNDFASESYEVDAQFYLLKPYSESQIETMLTRLNLDNYELRRTLTLPNGQQIILRNIIYTEYANHVLTIHSKSRDNLRVYMTQAEAESLLCTYPYFLVCSKGLIINLYEVKNKEATAFHMSDDSLLPISRRKAREVQDAYAAFCFEQMRKEVSD